MGQAMALALVVLAATAIGGVGGALAVVYLGGP